MAFHTMELPNLHLVQKNKWLRTEREIRNCFSQSDNFLDLIGKFNEINKQN